MKTKYILVFLILIPTTLLYAGGSEGKRSLADEDEMTQIRPQKIILPASLILVGSWGVCNGWSQSLKHTVRNNLVDLRKDRFVHADDYIQYLPAASNLGLGLIGAKAKHSFKERLIVTTTSCLVMGVMVNTVKLAVGEKRPDSSAKNSFPSGHTATAFMGAELVRMEYGTGYGFGAYLLAGGVAFLRLYNDRHWLNDVVAGAGFGILSARVGYWLLPINQKLFRINKNKAPVVVAMPTFDYQNKSFGGSFSVLF